jgi:RHS repeat-associated protein
LLLIASYSDDNYAQVIRKVSPDGSKIETIAGNATARTAPLGDGKPALQAHIGQVNDMTVGPDGTIYWVERWSATNNWKGRLRKIAPDGIVTTVAGGGDKVAENGTPASEVAIGSDPKGVALGNDGSIYLALGLEKKVVKIAPDGSTTRFAGKGVANERGKITLGGKASESYIDSPWSIAASSDGTVYIRSIGNDISPSASVILNVDENGTLQQYAGRMIGSCGSGAPDGENATSICMQNHSTTIGMDGDGGLTFADGRYLIRKVTPPLPGFTAEGLALPSSDGLEVYEFDRNGRHLRTRDGLTGAVVKTFEYDAAKCLTGVVDAYGNRTRIERSADGTATAIIAPGGQRTALAITAGGFLDGVTDPAGKQHVFAYHEGGLLASFKKPEGGTTRFDYDVTGRLIRHRGADGEERTLSRSEGEFGPTVTIKTAGGTETTYSMEVLANGDRRRTVQEPSGAKTVAVTRADGVSELTAPDGTKTAVEYAPDPRWGSAAQVVADKTVTTPGGKTTHSERTDAVTLRDPRDPFSITQLRTTFDVDGESSSWTYDGQRVTQRSAEGRETVQTLDAHSRVVKQTLGTGVAAIDYTYDDRGRPKTMKQGAEQTTFAYDAKFRLASSTDAAGDAISYVYDDADRVVEKRLPGNRTYKYTYDGDGNVATLTMPNGKVHRFSSTGDDRPESYTPPGAAAYERAYSTERTLGSTTLPSGAVQALGYDTAGRLTSEDHVQSKRTFAYDGERDRFDTVTRELANGSRKQTIGYAYDGLMPKSLEFTGAAAGRYDYTIGSRILPTNEKLTVGATEITRALEFDGDRLATKTGQFSIERSGPAGAVSKITDGKLSLTYGYDGNGRPATRTLSVNGSERFYQKLTFDNAGRAGAREERVDGGALDTLAYAYDGSGQLTTVKRGATVVESNAYDANGNRLSGGAAYDDRDRLTTRGGVGYTWDADGFLTGRGSDTFSYSRSGELLSATVGGATTTYSYDGFGRRTAAGTTKYLYGNPANAFQVTATVSGDVVTTYYYDADDRLFALERGGECYYVGTDPVGSPRIVVRASDGSVVRTVTYDSFGVEKDVTGSFEVPIGYAGGLRDTATGFVRFGARDYDPAAGRFTASDPAFFRGSAENLYRYANNNPITQKDPSGLACAGWSMYATFGGGFQFCRDNKLDWGADWSFCAEGGLGGGGGLDVDAVGGAQDTGAAVFAEATAKLGMVGGTVGGELDLGCMNAKASAKAMYGWGTVGIDTTGSVSVGGGQNDLPMPGARLEGKIGLKVCKKFGFI